MAINFPASPNVGDTYSFGGNSWIWSGTGWKSTSGLGPAVAIQSFTANGTYTPAAGMQYCSVELWGPGGDGSATVAHYGGAGGGYARKILTADQVGTSQTITIGPGGSSTATSFGSIFSATAGASAGASATAGGTGSNGDINLTGSSGIQGASGYHVQGGGSAPLMGIGAPVTIGTQTAIPNNTGGGGGGTATNGADGLCLITEFIGASYGTATPDQISVGDIIITMDETVRTGYVELDGSTLTDGVSDYPVLAARYAWMKSGNDIILPDFRGRFLRGWADAQTTDPDRASRTARAGDGQTGDYVGTYQVDGAPNIIGNTDFVATGTGSSGAITSHAGGSGVYTSGASGYWRYHGFNASQYDATYGALTQVAPININVLYQMRLV